MPAPTKKWGEAGTFNTQPDDSFLEDGLNPELPWPTRLVNWTLNFVWETLIGAEHDPFTGAHGDITFDSLTGNSGSTVTVVAEPVYKTGTPSAQMTLRLGMESFRELNSADTVTRENTYLELTDGEVGVACDLTPLIASARKSGVDALIKSVTAYLSHDSGSPEIRVRLERRDLSADVAWSLVSQKSFFSADISGTDNPPSAHSLDTVGSVTFGGVLILSSVALLEEGYQYRLVVGDVTSSGSHSARFYGADVVYQSTTINPG